MRVWDVAPSRLCDKHLLGQHAEIHAIHSIITNGKRGYANHPEVKRWVGCPWGAAGLEYQHYATQFEMERRGMNHQSPIFIPPGVSRWWPGRITPIDEQMRLLNAKPCPCDFPEVRDE